MRVVVGRPVDFRVAIAVVQCLGKRISAESRSCGFSLGEDVHLVEKHKHWADFVCLVFQLSAARAHFAKCASLFS